jgi:peptidyl-prolyl cis-trans isomerase A (cyclophilin A)
MKQLCVIACLFAVMCSACNSGSKSPFPQVAIRTTMGDIIVEVYPAKAPITANAFLRYVDSGYYTKGAFYRVLLQEGFSSSNNVGLIQGGIWQSEGKPYPNLPGIAHETTQKTGLTHTDGTISLARTKPGTANTEFFICIGNQTQFDYGNEQNGDKEGFAAFGTVIKGMSIVRSIQQQPANGESLLPRIEIKEVERL